MKQLYFVFAATAGLVLMTGDGNAATRYSNNSKRHELYQNYTGCNYTGCKTTAAAPVAMKKQETVRKTTKQASNKDVLADPFFQPRKGHFGSLSDLAWSSNAYDFEIVPGSGPWSTLTGDWSASEFSFKEDLSFGVTDDFSLMGMIKYANTKYEMDWAAFGTDPASTDTLDDNGIAIWGLGGQWKFVDNEQNVGNLGAFFQSSDLANNLMFTGKFGLKTSSDTTVYGLANVAYMMWADPSYGNGITSNIGQVAYMAFERDVSSSFYLEGGAGVFTKLSDQWSMNIEGIFGSYSWHNQISAKAAIYWQPTDTFALGLYGKASLWDSADSADDIYMYSWCAGTDTQCYIDAIALDPLSTPLEAHYMGTAAMDKYQDMQFGVQGMFYF